MSKRQKKSAVEKRSRTEDYFSLVSQARILEQLEQIMGDVVSYGESDSVILCGPPGSGKSTVVKRAILSMQTDTVNWPKFKCITLQGLHHGDTTSSVDYLLSELGADKNKSGGVIGSAAEKLRDLCDCLQNIAQKGQIKGIILIIDHFEQLIIQNNQTLLYNLFDTSHQKKFPLCIIAMSSILEVMEKMEKRVKSRFSQKVLHVASQQFVDAEEFRKAFIFLIQKRCPEVKNDLNVLLQDNEARSILDRVYNRQSDWCALTKFVQIIGAIAGEDLITAEHFKKASSMYFLDTTVEIIKGLPTLHLALTLCCLDYYRTHGRSEFSSVFIKEFLYNKIETKNLRFSEQIFRRAFVDLIESGILAHVGTGRSKNPSEYDQVTLNISKSQLRNALLKMDLSTVPTNLQQWCTSFQ